MSVKEGMENIDKKDDNGASSTSSRDEAIGRALLERLPAQKGTCPSVEDLATLADGTLAEAERDRLLGHVAACGRCREVFITAEQLARDERVITSKRSWYVASSLVAAAMLVVIAIRLLPSSSQNAVPELSQKEGVASSQVVEGPGGRSMVSSRAPSDETKKSPDKTAGAVKRSDGPLELLTAEEAALPSLKTYGFAGRERSEGPAIEVVSPSQEGEETSVTSLRIRFTPRQNGIDFSTLKVECLKEPQIDITPRLKPYITSKGINVKNVRIPEGLHRFRVSVTDYQGRLSEKEFTVNVAGRFWQ